MAIDLDGTDDYVTCGDIDALDGVAAMSIVGHFRLDTVANLKALVAKFAADGWIMETGTAGAGGSDDILVATGVLTYGYSTGNILVAGSWNHLAMVFDGSLTGDANRLKLFFGGVQQALTFSGSQPATVPVTANAVTIGADGTPSRYVDGQADDVRCFARALTAEEVSAHAAGYRGPLGGEVLWLSGNDFAGVAHPNGTTLTTSNVMSDLSGNGNDGVPTNSPIARASEAPRLGMMPFFASITGLIQITLTGAISAITGTQTEDITKVLSGSVSTITGSLTKSITKILSGAISSITGTFSISDYITKIWGFIKTIIAPASAVRGVIAPTTDVDGETAPKAGVKAEGQ